MKLLLLSLLFSVASAGLFDIFGGKKKEEVIHVTNPDPGELGRSSNSNLGDRVAVGRGRANGNEGSLVDIPRNSDTGKTTTRRVVRPFSDSTRAPPTFAPDTTTRRIPTTTERRDVTRILPSQETHGSGCPSRVDAFTVVNGFSVLIDGSNVFFVEGGRARSAGRLSDVFPGVQKVNAALYDPDKEVIVLISERKVYGFRVSGQRFSAHGDYPKDLPDNIAFTPNGALRWHDSHQMLLSSGGMFALYDEYWNKSLMTGRISSYLKGLPDRVRGSTDWKNGRASIYTQSLVFEYDKDREAVVGDGQSIGNFLHC